VRELWPEVRQIAAARAHGAPRGAKARRRARPNGMTAWSRGRLGCAAAWRCRWGGGLKLRGRPEACSPEKRTHLAAHPATLVKLLARPG